LFNASLIFYDILGNEVKRMENLNGKEIMISRNGMRNGMYFFRVVDGNTIAGQGKLIIEWKARLSNAYKWVIMLWTWNIILNSKALTKLVFISKIMFYVII